MFGYVKPLVSELRVREMEQYKAAYCGLCHSLGKRYGFFTRFLLSYDFVFLSLLLEKDGGGTASLRRCIVSPRRRRCLTCGSMETASAYCVILAYHKLRDDIADEGFAKRFLARAASVLIRWAYKKAAADYPGFDASVVENLDRLGEAERDASCPLDACADAFAKILESAQTPGTDGTRQRITGTLLYHIGRWIYLTDARDDILEDAKRNRYNVISAKTTKYGEAAPEDIDIRLKISLDKSLEIAGSALELLDDSGYTEVLRNILYLGLPAVQEAVFQGTYRPKSRNWRMRDSL